MSEYPPSSVKVGPVRYAVHHDSVKLGAYCLEQKGAYCGYCDHKKLEIVIDPDSAPDSAKETLVHELLHAILAASSLGQDMEGTESFVAKFSPWLLDTLQRNPELVAYLTEGGS